MAVKTFVYASALLMASTCAYASQDGMTKQESSLWPVYGRALWERRRSAPALTNMAIQVAIII